MHCCARGSPLSLNRSHINPLHNLVFINTEFHANPSCMPQPQGKPSLHFFGQHFYTFVISSVWVCCLFCSSDPPRNDHPKHLAMYKLLKLVTKIFCSLLLILPIKLEHLPQYLVLIHMHLFDNVYFSYYSRFLRHFLAFPNTKYTALYLKPHEVFQWPNSMVTGSCITQATRILYVPSVTRKIRTFRRKMAGAQQHYGIVQLSFVLRTLALRIIAISGRENFTCLPLEELLFFLGTWGL
jgi:hypothetical protein